jgi:hypothetical protein
LKQIEAPFNTNPKHCSNLSPFAFAVLLLLRTYLLLRIQRMILFAMIAGHIKSSRAYVKSSRQNNP